MVFCNMFKVIVFKQETKVTILILIDGFLQFNEYGSFINEENVTILILIDGFLQ